MYDIIIPSKAINTAFLTGIQPAAGDDSIIDLNCTDDEIYLVCGRFWAAEEAAATTKDKMIKGTGEIVKVADSTDAKKAFVQPYMLIAYNTAAQKVIA